MPKIDSSDYRYGKKTRFDTALENPLDRGEAKAHVADAVDAFSDLQERLYAENRQSLLLVFQGMDAAGKDSTIQKVTSGVDPAGFQVFNFKKPSSAEMDHNFLWRCWRVVPERGRIGIFNRSYYEEVLVVRVHPSIIDDRRLKHPEVNDDFWDDRFEDIRAMEKHLERNGTRVVKFFLNVGRDEQKQRFLSRLNEPEKHWKFSSSDLHERKYWQEYQEAFRAMLDGTDRNYAPWYVVPADDKWNMRAIVAQIIVDELTEMDPHYPEADAAEVARFDAARTELENDD